MLANIFNILLTRNVSLHEQVVLTLIERICFLIMY